MRIVIALFFGLLLGLGSVQAQTSVTIKRSDKLTLEEFEGQKMQKLLGDVWLVQDQTNIYCDSAYLSRATNVARAFGHVRIINLEENINIAGDSLLYNGNTQMAQLRSNVVMKDDSTTLYTDHLDYFRLTKQGRYFSGGQLIDAYNDLTSERGIYNANTKKSVFMDKVHLINVDLVMDTDTLYYDADISEMLARGNTVAITPESDTLRTSDGMLYNRNTEYAEVYHGNISGTDYYIEADSLFADNISEYYRAAFQIILKSYSDSLTIYGDQGTYNKLEKTARMHDNAYLKKMLQGDSLFIAADTLYSNQSDSTQKYLSAYRQVEMFKSDLQGVADSVTFQFSDSTIYMFQDPVVWAEDSQMTADSINIVMRNDKIDRMNMTKNAFVISKDSLAHFNQVKGREMEIFFKNGFLNKTIVNGNGESIYHLQEADGVLSLNKMRCSNMALYFEKNTVTEIRTYTQVDGSLIPESEILPIDKRLRGFEWFASNRKPKLYSIARHLRYDR